MESLKQETPGTNEKKPDALDRMYEEMRAMGLVPITLIRGAGMKENIGALDKAPKFDSKARSYAVFEVMMEYAPEQVHIYKSQFKESDNSGIDKEILFYREVLPRLKQLIDPAVLEQIEFPTLGQVYYDKDGVARGIVLFGLKGEILGKDDKSPAEKFEPKELDRVIAIIRAIQQVKIGELKKAAPSIDLKELDFAAIEHSYVQAGDPRRETIEKLLGLMSIEKMDALLDESARLQKNQPIRLLSEDIFSINLMRLPNGKLASFDWERLHLGKNPADDYGKLVSRMWNNRETQNLLIKKILTANSDIEGFRDMFRANLLSREGSHFLDYYDRILEEAKTNPEKYRDNTALLEEAHEGQKALKEMIRDIIDETGPWTQVQPS